MEEGRRHHDRIFFEALCGWAALDCSRRPYGSGKSTLFDALMAAAGAPVKRTSDARSRTMSTELRLGHCAYLGDRWSILDCPGSVEFGFETASALTAVDLAVVVCEPAAERGIEPAAADASP